MATTSTTRRREMEWIDYGLGALRAEALKRAPQAGDLSSVYEELAESGELAAYQARARFYEIGTPSGMAEASVFLSSLD